MIKQTATVSVQDQMTRAEVPLKPKINRLCILTDISDYISWILTELLKSAFCQMGNFAIMQNCR